MFIKRTVIILALVLVLGLGACTSAQVALTQADVTTACTVAPLLDASTSVADQAAVANACAVEAAVAPIVAPAITKAAVTP